jgi:Tfp pilus assembly protein PilF
LPQPAAFESRKGRLELHLGRTADAVATPGSVARLTESAPCRTVITLDRGTVVVDAKDLGGGELVIAAGDSNVRVRGTLFGVARERDALTVEVASGVVEVTSARRDHRVRAGERILVSSVGVATGRLAAGRADELERLLKEPKVIGLEALSPVESPATAALPRSAGADRGTLSLPTTLTDEPSPSELLARAETLRRAGDYAGARALYRQAGSTAGPTAEAAWLALARMELGLGDTVGARRATEERRRRFGRGTLGPEALWIDVRTHQQAGETAKARQIADELVSRWPGSPQAAAARRFLKGD